MSQHRMAMVSMVTRRDLQSPIRFFKRIEVVNLYRVQSTDITEHDLVHAERFAGPVGLYRRLSAFGPDLVQGPEPFGLKTLPYLAAVWLWTRRHGRKLLVISPENRPIAVKYGKVGGWLLRLLLEPYLQRACLIVHLNDGSKANFAYCRAPEDRLVRLMYGTWGVDIDEFSPDGPVRRDAEFETTILYVGRLVRAKGLFDLLDALVVIAQERPEAGLVLVGDGPDRDELRLYSQKRGLEEHVRFAGSIPNHELPTYLRGAAAFACPSVTTRGWQEQIGMANLQAMACGTPVISTRSGAIPEYVLDGETGLLVPEHDPQALAGAILSAIGDPVLADRLSEAGRQYAERTYDARQNVLGVEEVILDRCLASAPRGR